MVLCTRRSTHCGVEFLLSHDLSQVGSRSLWSRSWQTLCRRSWTECGLCHGSACSIASWSRSWMCQCHRSWRKSWSLLLVRSSATLVQASGDSLTRDSHRSIDTMRAHLRSCIVPEKQLMALVDACRTRSWLFMFHLRLIEDNDVEVLVAPSFRCDARVFLPLCRHVEPTRRFVVLRRRSSTALSRHTDSAKNCMACFRVCWIEMCSRKSSRVLAGPVPLVARRPPAIVVPVVVRLHQHGRISLAEWERAHRKHLAVYGLPC